MWPNTLTQLIGFIASVGIATFGAMKGWDWYLKSQKEIKIMEIGLENNKIKADISKIHENLLTAKQVAELMKATQEVKEDIAEVRKDNEDHNKELSNAMDKLEMNLRNFEETFTKFLVARLNQFDKAIQ